MRILHIAFFVILMFACPPDLSASPHCYPIVRVVDGDTVVVNIDGKITTVRLIGVDAPELDDPRPAIQAMAEQSALFLKEMLTGKCVTLEYGGQSFDKYQRTLAYLVLHDLSINFEMIRLGYARALTRFPFSYRDKYLIAESDARRAKRGLWREEAFEAVDGIIRDPSIDYSPSEIKINTGYGTYSLGEGGAIGSGSGGSTGGAQAGKEVRVRSYTRKDGTSVRSHSRSAPRRN